MFRARSVVFVALLCGVSDALSVRSRALPRVAPARRRVGVAPLSMSERQRENKSKLQTIVKDKVDEDTKVKEDLNLEEPWRVRRRPGFGRERRASSRAREPFSTRASDVGGSSCTTTTCTPLST